MGLTVEFFYSSLSTKNEQFGKNRSASVNAYIHPSFGSTDVFLYRGNEQSLCWHLVTTVAGVKYYTPDAGTPSPTTLTFASSKYTEQFPDGSHIEYSTALSGSYYISKAISASGAVPTSKARHSLVNSSTTDKIFSFVPFKQESWTKSIVQTSLGWLAEYGTALPDRFLQ